MYDELNSKITLIIDEAIASILKLEKEPKEFTVFSFNKKLTYEKFGLEFYDSLARSISIILFHEEYDFDRYLTSSEREFICYDLLMPFNYIPLNKNYLNIFTDVFQIIISVIYFFLEFNPSDNYSKIYLKEHPTLKINRPNNIKFTNSSKSKYYLILKKNISYTTSHKFAYTTSL